MSGPPTTSSQNEWDIKSGAHVCAGCEKPFEAKEGLYTRLIFTEQSYRREDHCLACWTPKLRKESISFWKTQYKPPPPKKEEALKKENVEDSLRAFIEEGDPSHMNTIFVLTLMLERKRILVEKDVQVQEDGRKLRMYEHKATGDTFVITDPDLKLAEVEAVQEEVATLLGWREKPMVEPELQQSAGHTFVGMQIETSNEIESSDERLITGLWERFAESQLADTISNRIPQSPVYGVYSNFATDGSGTFICTAAVAVEQGATHPEELALLEVVEGDYLVFPIAGTTLSEIQKAWVGIHRFFSEHENITRAFSVDYEAYLPDGSLLIYISVLPEQTEQAAAEAASPVDTAEVVAPPTDQAAEGAVTDPPDETPPDASGSDASGKK
ncbi:MAG: putative transcriptional regulator YdeE [Kiritimatiellia bacterium]|jgi:predicted transcriptional regulator YdeE